MKLFTNIRAWWKGIQDTIIRFPLTILLLAVGVVINAVIISRWTDKNLNEYLLTVYFGALLSAVLQLIYERFFSNEVIRIILGGISTIASVIYYLIIHSAGESEEVFIRVGIVFFILLISFLWVPVIGSRIDFNQSFMVAFKGFFGTVFFTGILFLGVVLIIGAFDILIVNISGQPYMHSANIIFLLLAPVYFLTLLPVYPKQVQEDKQLIENNLMKATSPAKFLETLISFIIIPITVVFTIILLLYIAINIMGDFWTNNLMEPLLISYSITVIIVYLLASRISNVFVKYYRLIFPKVLVPIVLFQTISSLIRGMTDGFTYGRYFVILFGTFSIITGILFCIIPVRKNGVIAPILIIMALISIVPPCDAFNISRVSQISRLENALKENNMLKENVIIPNADISKMNQEIIISSIDYLDRMDDTKEVTWLSGYYDTGDFEKTFGFTRFAVDKDKDRYVFISRKDNTLIKVTDYDYFIRLDISSEGNNSPVYDYEKDGIIYRLTLDESTGDIPVIILKEDGQEILRFDTTEMFLKFINSEDSSADTDELTFTQNNSSAAITVIAQSINISETMSGVSRYADVYVLVKIK